MRRIIEATRERILTAPDGVCLERARLVTEAYREHEGQPVPIKRARALAHVLENMSLDLVTNPVFAGNTSSAPRKWMLLPEYSFSVPGQAIVEKPELEGLLDGDAVPADLREYWRDRAFGGAAGLGHLAVDNRRLLAEGLESVAAGAERGADDPDAERAAYRSACAISCRAVIRWAERYAEAAAALAEKESDPELAACHRRVAEACQRVPARPARSLFEALQSLVLVHLALHLEGHGYSVSPGLLDRQLAPYAAGEEEAVELIAAFMLMLAANSAFGSHSKTQPITVGGVGADGRDAGSSVTLSVLKACALARVPDPSVFLRWHRDLPDEIKLEAVRMLASGASMPLLVGDAETIPGLTGAGVSGEDAAEYCIIGCNELGVPAKLIWDALRLPEAELAREAVLNAEGDELPRADVLLEKMATDATRRLRNGLRGRFEWHRRCAREVPMPFTSALMDGCVEAGRDFMVHTKYPFLNVRSSGFSNAVNALAAREELAEEGASLAELRAALSADFVGYEELRAAILAAPKWGNDDERADRWALAWQERRTQVLRELEAEHEGRRLLMEMVVRSLHHLEGAKLGATPDGRLSGEPLADSVGAVVGTARTGPTAVLNSVCKLRPAEHWPGGYNLNLTLPVTDWGGEEMTDKLRALVDVFFAGGGQELQINCVDSGVLREAQRHPERHPDLMVRIAGFNALFVKLSAREQDEIIHRAETAERR